MGVRLRVILRGEFEPGLDDLGALDTHGRNVSSGLLVFVAEGRPGGVFVVGGVVA